MKAQLHYRIARYLIYKIFRILFGLKREGLKNVPENGSVIIAPNHRSNYDPPLVGCCIENRPIYYLAKKGLFSFKAASWLLSSVNAVPVDTRKPRASTLRKFINLLKDNKAIMVFPEGTRSKTNEFLDANPGVGYLSIRTNTPVIPAFIEGTHESMFRHLFRITPLRVKFGEPVYPESLTPNIKNALKFSEKVLDKIKELQ